MNKIYTGMPLARFSLSIIPNGNDMMIVKCQWVFVTRHLHFVFCMLSLLTSVGCIPGAISPQQRVITHIDEEDFGLNGLWKMVDDPLFENADENKPISVQQNNNGVYIIQAESLREINVSLRATPLGNNERSTIVEVEVERKGVVELRYLLVLDRKEDWLRVRYVMAENFAQFMHEDGHSAVIEYATFSSPKVLANPEQLLACVQKHSNELLGNEVYFQLITK